MSRISGLVIFILLALVGGFVYLGYSNPEFSFRTQVNVAVPVEVAFAGFTDEARMSKWVSQLSAVQPLRGEPNSVGSFSRLVFNEGDRDAIVTREIVAYEENERLAFDLDENRMTASVDVLFEPTAAGTSIAAYQTVRGKGLFWRALLSLDADEIKARHRDDYRRLKAMLEAAED